MTLIKDTDFFGWVEFSLPLKGTTEAELDAETSLLMGNINIGALTIKAEDRELLLDVFSTDFYLDEEKKQWDVICKLEVDEETFEPEQLNLLLEDLFNPALTSTFYIGWEDDGFESYVPPLIEASLKFNDTMTLTFFASQEE